MRACSRVTVTPFEPDASASASAACSAASSSRASPPSPSSGSGSGGRDGSALAPAAQPRVHGAHHPLELLRRVGRQQLEPHAALPRALREERLQRPFEGVDADALRLGLVEHPVLGVDARRQRVRAQEARAEAVDRRDPGALRGPRLLALAQLEEAPPDAQLELGGGLLGERDGEDAIDHHAVLEHRAHEALDQHGGLAAAGAGVQEERARARLDRLPLLRREGHAHCSCLQIAGYSQPLPDHLQLSGQGRTSPVRTRCTRSQTVRPTCSSCSSTPAWSRKSLS